MSNAVPLISTGSILIYAGSDSPNEYYLLCKGQELSRNLYPNLFNIIGTTYGGIDSDSSFNLPNLTNRFPIMNKLENLGTTSGSQNTTVNANLPSHTHNTGNISLSDHTHGVQSSFPRNGHPNIIDSNYFPATSDNSPNGGPLGGWIFKNTNYEGPYNAQTITLTDSNLNSGSTIGNNNSSQDSVPIQNSYLTLNYIIKVLP